MSSNGSVKTSIALDANALSRAVSRIAHEIAEHNRDRDELALVGIVRRGASLAERVAAVLREHGLQVTVGTLDISFYRDDDKGEPGDPRLLGRNIPFDTHGAHLIMVDDVLYTGRTVRAAMEALTELGRPASIQLAVLVDRGERELPVRADYVGSNLPTPGGQRVYVRLSEVDGFDAVLQGEAVVKPPASQV